MQDITDRLGAELRTPPPATFDVAATVGAGRRAVRRRRLARGGAALALVLVAGGAGLAVTSQFGGAQVDGSVQVAAGVSTEGLEPTTGLSDGFPAGYDPRDDDVVLVRDGWEVAERVDGPVDDVASGSEKVTGSVGLALRRGDDTVWVLLYRHASVHGDPSSSTGGGLAEPAPAAGQADLASWLAFQKDRMRGAAG